MTVNEGWCEEPDVLVVTEYDWDEEEDNKPWQRSSSLIRGLAWIKNLLHMKLNTIGRKSGIREIEIQFTIAYDGSVT